MGRKRLCRDSWSASVERPRCGGGSSGGSPQGEARAALAAGPLRHLRAVQTCLATHVYTCASGMGTHVPAAVRDDPTVEQRVSLITLGVSDLARARAFYEALGWRSDT